MILKILVNVYACGLLVLAATSGGALAQNVTGAEARLREKNIELPHEPSPIANYVNSVQVGKLLFLAGNTAEAGGSPKRQGWQGYYRTGRL